MSKKKKLQKQKLSNEPLEKCIRCKRWISFDDYFLNNKMCEECNAAIISEQDDKA